MSPVTPDLVTFTPESVRRQSPSDRYPPSGAPKAGCVTAQHLEGSYPFDTHADSTTFILWQIKVFNTKLWVVLQF